MRLQHRNLPNLGNNYFANFEGLVLGCPCQHRRCAARSQIGHDQLEYLDGPASFFVVQIFRLLFRSVIQVFSQRRHFLQYGHLRITFVEIFDFMKVQLNTMGAFFVLQQVDLGLERQQVLG